MSDATDWQADLDVRRLALFLDVDGTLLGFRDRPEEVVADEALRTLLLALQRDTGGALALVSGRTLADLDRIVAPLVLAAGGTHGAEMRRLDRPVERVGAEALAQVRPLVERFCAGREGLMLEDKGAALAVHFRRTPASEAEVVAFLEETVRGRDLMVQRGKMVAEIKSGRSSKGAAIESFMREPPFAGRTPVFIGDDLTDEHGFASVNELDGVSVKVGAADEPTVARRRLADVAAVRAFLDGLHRRTS